MADDRSRRIDDALASLVDSLLPPPSSDEDDNALDERHDNAVELARSILQKPLPPRSVSDVNGASDLIKKKLLRENSSPEKAVRFSNLYQRLLTQPVLSQKWALGYTSHPPLYTWLQIIFFKIFGERPCISFSRLVTSCFSWMNRGGSVKMNPSAKEPADKLRKVIPLRWP